MGLYDRPVNTSPEGSEAPGCRETAFVTLILIGLAAVFMVAGLSLSGQESCTGLCETLALTMLYAGGPVSAAFGVLFGDLVLAWPLDITFWVATGFLVARWAGRRERSPIPVALLIVVAALVYGLVLSQFVEIAV